MHSYQEKLRSANDATKIWICCICSIDIILILGCSKTAEEPKTAKIEPKFEPPAKESADVNKPQPAVEKTTKVIEQRLMPFEDTTTFKKLHTAEIICMSRPDAKMDPNAHEPNMNNDWYVRIDGKSGPRHDGIGMIAFSP